MAAKPILDAGNIHAVVKTRWDNGPYKPFTIDSIQSYTIETNLDEDSDPFNIVIGDRTGEFAEMLHRDNEVQIQIFGIGDGIQYLMTGIMDTVVYSDEGIYVCSGRDLSCVATDTFAEPQVYHRQKASDIILDQAKKLKCGVRWTLTPTNVLGKIATDGSETVWEFWYRYIRRAGQYLWFEPDGTLVSAKLNYDVSPTYFLGTPPKGDSPSKWIPVERGEFHSSKQQRLGTARLYYHNNHKLTPVTVPDPTIKDWLRKPMKFFESNSIVHPPAAKAFALEEIHESQVGAQEIKLVIPDPGVIIRQNSIAELNVPNLSLAGKWFIVGTRIIADESGFTQEVRLRESNFAISRRVPADPPTSQEPGKDTTTALADFLTIPNHQEWAQFFINSAKAFHGQYEFEWFLAVMLGICDVETGGSFTNVRNNGGPGVHGVEWFEWNRVIGGPQNGIKDLPEWQLSFGNEAGGYGGANYAVGPMQLFTPSFKVKADHEPNDGVVSELHGNRWNPENNIWVGGWVLNGKCEHLPGDPGSIWQGVALYGEGPAYANKVRALVEGEAGYYAQVKESFLSAQQQAKNQVGAVEAIDGSNKELATAVLDYYKAHPPSYRDDTRGADLAQIQAMKDGKRVDSPSCPEAGMVQINSKVLGAMKLLMDNGYWIGTFALCTDHQHLGCKSDHSHGNAVDIDSVGSPETGWVYVATGGKTAETLIIGIMTLLRKQKEGVYKPWDLICTGNGHDNAKIQSLQLDNYETRGGGWGGTDHLNHIHVGFGHNAN